MRKRLFTGLLALALTLSLLPVSALAAETLDRFTSWHYLYEYNPQAKKYMQMSGEQATALSRARSEYGVKPYSIIGDDLPTTQKIEVPTAESYTIAIDEQYGVPVMSYTDKGGIEYTWLNIGYIIDDTLYKWTAEDLAAGGVTKDFSELAGEVLSVTYCWVPIDKLEENTESEFDTVTISFDLWSHILTSEGQGVDPPLNLPEDCDFSQEAATAALYGSNSYYGKPADISQGVKDGKVVLTDPQPVDGKLTLEWAKGYYVDLEEAFEAEFDTYRYYYVQISCGKYIWYGELTTGSWRDAPGDEESDLISSRIKADEDRTVYARFDSLFPYYVPAEGYNTTTIGYSSSVAEESEWSETEFREVRKQITFPDWNFPSGEVAIPSENWTFKFPAPLATSTGENGEVYLDYTDGSFRWQCVGVQYRLNYDEEYTYIPWQDWRTLREVTIEDTTGIGNRFALYYVWKEINWDEAPEMYNLVYDINEDGLRALNFDPNDITRIDGVEYYESADGDSDQYYFSPSSHDYQMYLKDIAAVVSKIVNETNSPVREKTSFTVGKYPESGRNVPADPYYNFLVQDEDANRYFKFAGWIAEDGKTYQFNDTLVAGPELAGGDNTITFKVKWEEISALEEEELAKIESELPLDVFYAGDGVGQNVLITQKTSVDENLDGNKRKTGNPVILGKDETIEYQVSASVNGSLTGIGGSQGQNYTKEFAKFQFCLNVDENLEFANVAEDGRVTITFSAEPDSRHKYAPVTLEKTNITDATTDKSDEGLYTITFDPKKVPKDAEGRMNIVLFLQWNGDGWKGPMGVENTDSTASMTLKDLVFKVKEEALSATGEVPKIESFANIIADINMKYKTANAREYYETASGHLTSSRWGWEEYFIGDAAADPSSIPYSHGLTEAYAEALQFMNYKLKGYNLAEDALCALDANTVVAYGSAVIVNPADMTIYEGGDGGYDAVVDKTGQVVANGSASLPHPLFEIAAPEGVVLNGMTFTNADSSNTWTLEKLGQTDYYRFVPATGGTEVRVQYSDGSTVVTEDEFTPETDVFKQYTVCI